MKGLGTHLIVENIILVPQKQTMSIQLQWSRLLIAFYIFYIMND